MRSFTTSSLQWFVGLYSICIGVLMLITPHQFASATFLPLQPALAWWGIGFLFAGSSLIGIAVLAPRRLLVLLAHLFAGAILLSLAYAFSTTAAWTGTSNYLVLGLATLAAPLLARQPRHAPPAGATTSDLFACMMGLAEALTGLVLISLPDQFRTPAYESLQPYLPWYGVTFLVAGLWLLATQVRHPRRPWLAWLAHLAAGGAYVFFCLVFAIPNRGLSGIALYGGLGGALMLQPWLTPIFTRIDPARLQTRLALALVALAALPLVIGVAVISAREQDAATALALSRQEGLAAALAENTSNYIGLHHDAVIGLAGQLSRLPPTPAAHQPALQQFRAAYSDITAFISYDVNGDPIAGSDAQAQLFSASGLSAFETVRETLAPAIEVRISRSYNLPILALSAPLISPDGQFAGVVLGVLETARLSESLSQGTISNAGEIYVVDSRGRVISHPEETVAQAFAERAGLPPVAAALVDQDSGSLAYTSGGEPRLTGYAPVAELGWAVIVDRPASAVLGGVRAGQELAVMVLALVIAGAVTVSIFLARALTVPLTMLAVATRQLATGDGSAPLPQSSVRELATLAETFAELRHRLSQRTHERNQVTARLQALADVGKVLSAPLEASAMVDQLTQIVVPALADWCSIYLRQPDDSVALAAVTHTDPELVALASELQRRYPPDPDSHSGVMHVMRTGQAERINDITDEVLQSVAQDAGHLELLRRVGMRAIMFLPLTARGRTLGALVLVAIEPGRFFSDADLNLATELARRAALALDNAQLYAAEREARRSAELASAYSARLQHVTAALSGAPTPDHVAQVLATEGAAAIGADAAAIALFAPDGDGLEIRHASGYPPELIADFRELSLDGPNPLSDALQQREAIFIGSLNEARQHYPGLIAQQTQSGMQAWAVLPLLINQQTLGALGLSFASPHAFDNDERAFLRALAQQGSQALERARLYADAQRASAEAVAAVRVRDQFLSIAAHELKTPLTPLLGQAQLLLRRAERDNSLNERDRRAIQMIADQAARLSLLVTSLLDLNRLQSGNITLSTKQLDLCALLRRLSEELQATLARHTIVLDQPPEPVQIVGDPLRLEQVFQNLLQNAVKYSPEGGTVAVEVAVDGEGARVVVRDNGIGIPHEALPRLFQPFYRASNAERSAAAGMGVGLAVVNELVLLHGGSIAVESEEGRGSTFTVRLPLAGPPAATPEVAAVTPRSAPDRR